MHIESRNWDSFTREQLIGILETENLPFLEKKKIRSTLTKMDSFKKSSSWRDKIGFGLLETHQIAGTIYTVRRYADRIAIQSPIEDAISWETLQKIKTDLIGDVVAIEIFPKNSKVVNFRNTRRLWYGESLEKLNIMEIFKHPEFQ